MASSSLNSGAPKALGLLPGLLLCSVLAGASVWLGGFDGMQSWGLSPLSLAIVFGMLIGNTIYPRIGWKVESGVNFSKAKLLRLGIILYGLKVTMQEVLQVGVGGIVIDVLVVGLTFVLALWLGTRWLGMDRKTTMLIGSGAAICGAAAVLAVEPVVKGRPEQVTVAVATVVVFGTLGLFLYPVLFRLNQSLGWLPVEPHQFGIYIGSTIHEVAQVVAAGDSVGSRAADTAVIVKMVRVMLLAPFLIALSYGLSKYPDPADGATTDGGKNPVVIPWFAVWFVVVVLFNSLHLLPQVVHATAITIDNLLLAMAMAALGLTTHVGAIRKAGVKPLLLASMLFVWLVVGGGLLNRWIIGG